MALRPPIQVEAFPPRTHRDDPVTSFRAEERVRGVVHARRAELLDMLERTPALRASQIAEYLADHYVWPVDPVERLFEVRRRLSDLAHADPPRLRRQRWAGEDEARWFVVPGGESR